MFRQLSASGRSLNPGDVVFCSEVYDGEYPDDYLLVQLEVKKTFPASADKIKGTMNAFRSLVSEEEAALSHESHLVVVEKIICSFSYLWGKYRSIKPGSKFIVDRLSLSVFCGRGFRKDDYVDSIQVSPEVFCTTDSTYSFGNLTATINKFKANSELRGSFRALREEKGDIIMNVPMTVCGTSIGAGCVKLSFKKDDTLATFGERRSISWLNSKYYDLPSDEVALLFPSGGRMGLGRLPGNESRFRRQVG